MNVLSCITLQLEGRLYFLNSFEIACMIGQDLKKKKKLSRRMTSVQGHIWCRAQLLLSKICCIFYPLSFILSQLVLQKLAL